MRKMKDFQVAVQYEAVGYVTVRAKSKKDAAQAVRALAVQMDYEGCEANTDMMPFTPNLTITNEPEEVEDDDGDI